MDSVGNVLGAFTRATDSVAVDLVWQGKATGWLAAFRADGSFVDTSVDGGTGTHRLTLDGGGFVEFGAGVFPDFMAPGPPPFAWGVAGVEISNQPVHTAPEPGALVLAGLGVLGLIARYAHGIRRAVGDS